MRTSTQIPDGLKDFYEQMEQILNQMSRCMPSEFVHIAIKKEYEKLLKKVNHLDLQLSDERASSDMSNNENFVAPINSEPDVIVLSIQNQSEWDQIKLRLEYLFAINFQGLILIEDEDFHIRDISPETISALNLVVHDSIPEDLEEIRSGILFDENKMRIVILGWLAQIKNLADALETHLQEKDSVVVAQLFLNEKHRINKNTSALRKMSRKMGVIKSGISRQIKAMTQEAFENLQKEISKKDGDIQQVYKQFELYDGFATEDIVRNTQISVPEGFIERSLDLTKESFSNALSKNYSWIENACQGLNANVRSSLKNLEVNADIEMDMPLDKREMEWVVNDNINGDGDWERSFQRKGLYHLFMELRTPMFMLLPFMMIGSLFAALLIGVDEGIINTSLTHDETRKEIVVIAKLPSKYFPDDPNRQGHLTFIEDVNKRIKDGVFDRNTVTILEHEREFDRYNKEVKVARFNFDPITNNLTLYPVSNRIEVIEILKDPTFKLLHQGGGNIRMGYSALFQLMAKVSDYKYLVFGGLMLLILWYSRKKFLDYQKEKVETAAKEKRSLRHLLRSTFEKSLQNGIHAWQSSVNDSYRSYQELIVQNVQRAIDEKVEEETMIAQEEKMLSDTRNKNFSKSEKEIQSVLKETNQLSRELDRAIKDGIRMSQRVKRSTV